MRRTLVRRVMERHFQDTFLKEELVILGVIDEAWQRDAMPDDTLVSNVAMEEPTDTNDVDGKAKTKVAERWNYHGLSDY